MPDSPIDQDHLETHHTRRDFIKNMLVKTAYAVPIVATFSVSDADAKVSRPSGNSGWGKKSRKRRKKRSKRGKRSNNSNRKISKVSRPSRPSSGSGIQYRKKRRG